MWGYQAGSATRRWHGAGHNRCGQHDEVPWHDALTDAVRRAAAGVKSTEAKATVVLITGGIETCDADPCALGMALEASGLDFTAHVVGFGLTEDDGQAVACLAENTGGKYIQASDAGALVDALKTTVVLAKPEPAPQPIPEPEPHPLR